jgi:hypothetical protein
MTTFVTSVRLLLMSASHRQNPSPQATLRRRVLNRSRPRSRAHPNQVNAAARGGRLPCIQLGEEEG